jgi:hypothetical protein
VTEGWVDDRGHPLYLIDGEKICSRCPGYTADTELFVCKYGHTYIRGKGCRVCEAWRTAPWLKQLDQTGETVCSRGHEHTHETLLYSRTANGGAERKCPQCVEGSMAKATASYVERMAKEREVTGRTYSVKTRLPYTYVDWVVVQRLIDGKVDEVHQIMRDDSRGPTLMERWVAVCSTPPWKPFIRSSSDGHTSDRRPDWEKIGKSYGWEPKTITQVMAEI